MSQLRIVIDSQIAQADQASRYQPASGARRTLLVRLADFIVQLASGGPFRPATFSIQSDDGGVRASGTVTPASVQAADTFTINGVTFTAVANGATGNQFNLGANNAETGANMAAAVNASASAAVARYVTAAAAANGVVTITARMCGYPGNLFPLASSNGTRLAVSGSTLANGTEDANFRQFTL